MNLKNNTILITGGTSGIGLALAIKFLEKDNTVIVCGRNMTKLNEVKSKYPQLHIKNCDIKNEADRIYLFDTVTEEFPELNIIINNAGIQQQINLKEADWKACQNEIAINLEAPIHLSTLFISHLLNKENAFIINVTSGLAFMPPIWVPVYGATKAGLHSFTFCLREQLSDTNIGVVEIIPPAVNTNLGGEDVHTFGVNVDVYIDSVFKGFENDSKEIVFEEMNEIADKSRKELELNAIGMYKKFFQK